MNIGELKKILSKCELPDNAEVKFIRLSHQEDEDSEKEHESDGSFEVTTRYGPMDKNKNQKISEELALFIEPLD